MDFIAGIFFSLDSAIYWLIGEAYKLFYSLANTMVISNETLQALTSRVYALIGIFMLFKVTFSLLNMFAEPDKLSDSKTGGAALVKRIIIAMILIVTVPTIFRVAYQIQGEILKQNILANIVFGTSSKSTIGTTEDTMGEELKVRLFSAFVQPKGGNYSTMPAAYGEALTTPDFSKYEEVVKDDNVNYMLVVSSVGGIFAAWIMLMFCFDVAIRSVKLGFLQLIAPIPILNYIDTKKGTETFNKWVSTTVSTFADIFVRLLSIYFGMFILSEIFKNGFRIYDVTNVVDGKYQVMQNVNPVLQVFVILGILLFMKEAPGLIYDILGIKKSGGGFTMNPFNRLRQAPGLSKIGGAALGAFSGAIAGGIAGKDIGNIGAGIRRGALTGLTSGYSKYNWAGSKDGASKKVFSSTLGETYKSLSGKEFKRFGLNDILPKTEGNDRIDKMKAIKKVLTGEKNNLATKLNAVSFANANLKREMETLDPASDAYKNLETRYNTNVEVENSLRSSISAYEGRISTIGDEIKDINRFYRIDESSKENVDKVTKFINKDEELVRKVDVEYNKNVEERQKAKEEKINEIKSTIFGPGSINVEDKTQRQSTTTKTVEQPQVASTQTNTTVEFNNTTQVNNTQTTVRNTIDRGLSREELEVRKNMTNEERIARARDLMNKNSNEEPRE